MDGVGELLMFNAKAPPYVTPPIRHVGFDKETGDIVVVDQHRNEIVVIQSGVVLIAQCDQEEARLNGWEYLSQTDETERLARLVRVIRR